MHKLDLFWSVVAAATANGFKAKHDQFKSVITLPAASSQFENTFYEFVAHARGDTDIFVSVVLCVQKKDTIYRTGLLYSSDWVKNKFADEARMFIGKYRKEAESLRTNYAERKTQRIVNDVFVKEHV